MKSWLRSGLVGGVTGGLRAEGLGWGLRVERECVKEKRLKKREKRSDSQHFKGLKRGVLRAFWDLKAENGVFFRTEVFLDSIFSFLLIFYVTIFSPHETSTRGSGRER